MILLEIAIAIVLILLLLYAFSSDSTPIYLHPCGNKNCKRVRLEKDGRKSQDIMEGMKCPICKENFQKLIDSCKE